MISPDGGLIVSGQKGTYSLDPNDTVIAGTNLGQTAGRQSGISADGIIQELKNVTGVLNKINQKEGTVRIGTTAAGTAFAVGTSKLQ